MRRVDVAEALDDVRRRERCGDHVDGRVKRAIEASAGLYLLTVEDEETFFSLIWQAHPKTAILTPHGEPRTLGDVGPRMAKLSFDALCAGSQYPVHLYERQWFTKCRDIDATFSFDRFGWVSVVLPKANELSESPKGTFYIFDGVHKTLVLAKRLFCHEVAYRPVEALLLVPRP